MSVTRTDTSLADIASRNASSSLTFSIPSSPVTNMAWEQSYSSSSTAAVVSSDSDSDDDPLKSLKPEEVGYWNEYIDKMGGMEYLSQLKTPDINSQHKKVEESYVLAGGHDSLKRIALNKTFLPRLKKLKANHIKEERERARAKREKKLLRKKLKKAGNFHFKSAAEGEQRSGGAMYLVPKEAIEAFLGSIRVQ